jgi:nickel superoxide dismutase
MKILLSLAAMAASLPLVNSSATVEPSPAIAPFHCQVPCGIYGDKMRIDMLMEDAATIEKAMASIQTRQEDDAPSGANTNQLVRWVMNKESHAQNIQDTVASYWLAQRVKAPKDAAGADKYHAQLTSMHRITVAAMKCKQTTDKSHVEALRAAALEFSATYFNAEDLKHIQSHHNGAHK